VQGGAGAGAGGTGAGAGGAGAGARGAGADTRGVDIVEKVQYKCKCIAH